MRGFVLTTRMTACFGTAAVLACTIGIAPAAAKGTARVQESTGTVRTYSNVGIRIVDKTLRITSEDGKGTLIISQAKCTTDGNLKTCRPVTISLARGGRTRPIDLERGTIYANNSDQAQQIPLSSIQVPPHGIVMSLVTRIGTTTRTSTVTSITSTSTVMSTTST